MGDVREIAKQAQALRAAGRNRAAIPLLEQVVALNPTSGVAEHNLAAALGDCGRWRDAEQHARMALSKGLDAPETWLVLGRAALLTMQAAEAEAAFLRALNRRPGYQDAHRDLAQLRWMASGDLDFALAPLEAAIAAAPQDAGLQIVKAVVLENAGKPEQAADALAAVFQAMPNRADIAAMAARSALEAGRVDMALALSAAALSLDGSLQNALIVRTEAFLSANRADQALPIAERLYALYPASQNAIALLATCWRCLGDARYRDLYDYERFVRPMELACPAGWGSLAEYLADLAKTLAAAHTFQTHPFHQSIKEGSQVPSILDIDSPATRALPEALDRPIREYMSAIGTAPDPFRSRNTGRYTFQGIWSIRMKAGGRHINHVHPEGWISSACYVEVPPTSGREGWITFGEPPMRMSSPCLPEYFVEPKPGRLVLFPSYMWHGTIPFTSEGARMTFALDILPD